MNLTVEPDFKTLALLNLISQESCPKRKQRLREQLKAEEKIKEETEFLKPFEDIDVFE